MSAPTTAAEPNRFQRLRWRTGHTQEEVAEATGLHRGTIRNLEGGDQQPIGRTAYALARFYGVTVEQVMGTEDIDYEALPEHGTEHGTARA